MPLGRPEARWRSFDPLRFLEPPTEPGVRVPTHRVLHERAGYAGFRVPASAPTSAKATERRYSTTTSSRSRQAASPLLPFALQTAFPPSEAGRCSGDYYGSYAPTQRHQQTLRLAYPASGVRRHRAGSHVHCRSFGGVGAQLFPCGPGEAITRTLATRPRQTNPAAEGRVPRQNRVPAHHLPGPYPSGLSRGLRLRGFNHWFTRITHCPPCLPRPRHPTVLARRVVVRAACRPSPQLQGQAALSFTGLPRQPGGEVSHPTRSVSASWRTLPSQDSRQGHENDRSCENARSRV
jgi:hypothetical protein